jgi:chemotaxis protein MotB
MKMKLVFIALLGMFFLNSCTAHKEMVQSQQEKIASLEQEVARLKLITEAKDLDLEALMGKLDEIKNVSVKNNRVVLPNAILFASGGTRVSEEGKQILDQLWDILVTVPQREILIEGHTDNVPIAQKDLEKFKSNWELSATRSLSVLHYVSKHANANPARLGAVGYGEFRPVGSNDTEAGRQLNRRVELVIGRSLE